MDHKTAMEHVLHYIDVHIKEKLFLSTIAREIGYSPCYFSRWFSAKAGVTIASYITWRKLQHARFDISRGMKVIDAAMEYGFDTHTGFTKAFKRRFGYTPSFCYLRLGIDRPGPVREQHIREEYMGGITMHPHIIELSPFSVVGYAERHERPSVRRTADIPAFWDTLKKDCGPVLTKLHAAFTHSKHFEISLCYDVEPESGAFTYLLGRGIDQTADFASMEADMTRIDIPGGLYAVFSTVPAQEYIIPIQETWHYILCDWLPGSEFEMDETRLDFEYYDHRDHGWYFGGKQQMDICIPIRQKENEWKASRERGCVL